MINEEKDPFQRMTDEAFEEAEQRWEDIDERLESNSRDFEANETSYHTAPTTLSSKEERDWVTGVHAAALIGYVFPSAWVFGPLVVWLLKKDESAAVDQHGRDVLNFQISMVIYLAIAALLSIILIGIPALVVIGLVQLVATIIGIVNASQGKRFKYPWALKIL
ncbi:MAG: DUF4870 domain-containing protein [Bacteroidota bacterium]